MVPRLGGVGRLGGGEDLKLDALDCTQLLGPPVIDLPLACRGPNVLGPGIGQFVRVVISCPVIRETERERERERERDRES